MYMHVYVCVYVCVYAHIRKRRDLYISYIVYICDILVFYKFSIIINPASWRQHANKEYYYTRVRVLLYMCLYASLVYHSPMR